MNVMVAEAAPIVIIVFSNFSYVHYIAATLYSATALQVNNVEISVANDGSTDNTVDVVEENAETYDISTRNVRDLVSPGTTGLQRARVDWLVFPYSDDILCNATLQSLLLFPQEHTETDIAVCRTLFFQTSTGSTLPEPVGEWRLFDQEFDIDLCHFNIAHPHVFMVLCELAEKVARSTLPSVHSKTMTTDSDASRQAEPSRPTPTHRSCIGGTRRTCPQT